MSKRFITALSALLLVGTTLITGQSAAQADASPYTVLAPVSGQSIQLNKTSSSNFVLTLSADNPYTVAANRITFKQNGNAVATYSWTTPYLNRTTHTFGLTNLRNVSYETGWFATTYTGYESSPIAWSKFRVVPGTYSLQVEVANASSGDPSTYTYLEAGVIDNIVIGPVNGVKCSAGSYSKTGTWTTKTPCTLASKGNFVAKAGAKKQVKAAAGKFVSYVGSSTQVPCNIGSYQPAVGKSTCTLSAPGHYVDLYGQTAQKPCPKGKFTATTGNFACGPAAPGHYVAKTGQTTQQACARGTYQANFGATACLKAPSGFYIPDVAANVAIACDLGTYQNLTGQVACKPTTPGHYADVMGQSSQKDCPIGYFQPEGNARYCLAAPAGKYVNRVAQSSAQICPAGTYQSDEGQTSCIAAPAGNFTPVDGSETPYLCPAGMYQPLSGQSSCTNTSAGYYSGPGSVAQTICPIGTWSEVSASVCTACPDTYTTLSTGSTSAASCSIHIGISDAIMRFAALRPALY